MEKVTYIIPVCNMVDSEFDNRLESLNFMIFEFLGKQTNIEIDLIVVEQVVNNDFRKYTDYIKAPENINYNNFVVSYRDFDKPWLINIGFNNLNTNHVLVAEMEMYSDKDFFSDLIKWANNKKYQWFFAWNRIYKTSELERKKILELKQEYSNGTGEFITAKRGLSEGGIIYWHKEFFLALGMGNEWIKYLGAVDNEIISRASCITRNYPKYEIDIMHLWHPDSPMKTGYSRSINRLLYEFTDTNQLTVNKILCSRSLGNLDFPACAEVTIRELFGINNKGGRRDIGKRPILSRIDQRNITRQNIAEAKRLSAQRQKTREILEKRKKIKEALQERAMIDRELKVKRRIEQLKKVESMS